MSWVLSPKTIRAIRPLERRDTFAWLTSKVRDPRGRAFNQFDYPWTRGVCEAWDDPAVRIVALQFAARLGKTFLACGLMMSAEEHDPANGMVGAPTEQMLKDLIRDKYYPMLDRCPDTWGLIPDQSDRNQLRIDLTTARIYGAWAKSPTTRADKDTRYKHGGEIDKWSTESSREADPLDLFMERGIEIPDGKTVLESTPTLKGLSRIERYLHAGWNCRWEVPCPNCGDRIELIFGDGVTGGVKFDKLPDGMPDVAIASRTARYLCQLCLTEWGDDKRRWAIQRGVWVPDGMTADHDGNLSGDMKGDPTIASFQLGRIYAPTFNFGKIAAQIAQCLIDPEKWQNTRNSWAGYTHERRTAIREWHEVGQRLCGEYEMGVVPGGGIFLTIGIDVQGDAWVWVVVAWGRQGVGWIVDYGIAYSAREVETVWRHRYGHQDGGAPMTCRMGLMDSGQGIRQDEVYGFCKQLNRESGPWLWPSKGSTGALAGGKPYTQQTFDAMTQSDKRRKVSRRFRGLKGFFHVLVSTPWHQAWLHRALHWLKPGDARSITLPIEAAEDEDFLRQLVNEQPEDSKKATGHERSVWVVVDETVPLDFRDALRYARCAAEVFTRGAWLRLPATRRALAQPAEPEKEKAERPAPRTPKQRGFIRRSGSSFIRNR